MNIVPILLYGKYPNVTLVVCPTAQLAVSKERQRNSSPFVFVLSVVLPFFTPIWWPGLKSGWIENPILSAERQRNSNPFLFVLSVSALVVVLLFFTPIWWPGLNSGWIENPILSAEKQRNSSPFVFVLWFCHFSHQSGDLVWTQDG